MKLENRKNPENRPKNIVESNTENSEDEFIADVIEQVEAKFGKGSAITLESERIFSYVPGYISTQCLGLNYAIGQPGIPLGRLTEIVGLPSTSKTALVIHILAECQEQGGVSILLDTENAFDATFASNLGLDIKRLICLQPGTIEEVFAEMEHIIKVVKKKRSKVPLVIALDSLAAAPTRAEVEGDYGDSFPALHARTISASIRKILPLITKEKIGVVIINQLKEKIGVIFGDRYVSFGGKALRFHASLRIRVDQRGKIKRKDDIVGITIRARIIKNKIAVPFKETTYDFYFEKGIDNASSVLNLAEKLGKIEKKKGFYFVEDEKFRASEANQSKFIKKFDTKIREQLQGKKLTKDLKND